METIFIDGLLIGVMVTFPIVYTVYMVVNGEKDEGI